MAPHAPNCPQEPPRKESLPLTDFLPDCMTPDGAAPCEGYAQLRATNARLTAAAVEWKGIFGTLYMYSVPPGFKSF